MPTIRDVAKYAGVSFGTVSNVLNGVSTVTEENRIKVENAIAQLGYRRNQAAFQLRSNRSNSIGLVIPDITNPFYPEVARGVDDMARSSRFNMFLCNKDRSDQKENDAVEALLEKNVDGIVLVKPRMTPERINDINILCPLVLVDADPANVTCDVVNVDDYSGMATAVEKCVALGHVKIAFISGLKDSYSSQRRLNAFRETMQKYGLPIPDGYIGEGDFTADSGKRIFRQFMNLQAPPTVVMAANDMMALGCISAAHEMGVNVPEDVSIVGYDDIQSAQLSTPRLTTILHPKYELGQTAMKVLRQRIEARRNDIALDQTILNLSTSMTVRETLKPVQVI